MKGDYVLREDLVLSSSFLHGCSSLFEDWEGYTVGDSALRAAFQNHPHNNNQEVIKVKAILLNRLYYAGIINIYRMATHIYNLRVDEKLRTGDLSVVDDIRLGHQIGDPERDFYCFATKYANFHQPNHFPIFDSLVQKMLTRLNRKFGFCQGFNQSALKNYPFLKEVVDRLIDHLGLDGNDYNYKRIDQGLWLYAKYYYEKNPPRALNDQVRELVAIESN